jgi:hypothetical protein
MINEQFLVSGFSFSVFIYSFGSLPMVDDSCGSGFAFVCGNGFLS